MAPGKCLYELLEITKDADEDAVKKAYRRQALIWHPDKNAHRMEEAVERFKEVQNAYEVLSDPHERAWYDSHRDQILKSGDRHQAGGSGFEGGTRPDDEEDMFPYFSTSCFSGYGDGAKSFYGVYGALFERLARQETEAFASRDDDDEAGSGAKECPSFPRFGSPNSDAAEVGAFYGFWSHFSTFKQFAWADLYNPASAPNRPVRRRMEEENRKARKAKRKEFNDTVRELVAFIRKRDKRVAKFQAEEAARRAARLAEDEERRRADKEARLAAALQTQEADWIRASEAAATGKDDGGGEDSEPEQEGFYCVACDKAFRSDKQLQNHERSKKHLEAVAHLRAVLEAEGRELDADGALHEALGGSSKAAEQPQQQDGARRSKKKNKKKGKQMRGAQVEEDDDGEEGDDAVTSGQQQPQQQQKQQAARRGATGRQGAEAAAAGTSEDAGSEEEEEEDEDAALARMLRSKGRVQEEPRSSAEDEETEEEEGADAEGRGEHRDPDGEPGVSRQRGGEEQAEEEEEEEEQDEDEEAILARLVGGRKAGPSGRGQGAASQPAAGKKRAGHKPDAVPATGGVDEDGETTEATAPVPATAQAAARPRRRSAGSDYEEGADGEAALDEDVEEAMRDRPGGGRKAGKKAAGGRGAGKAGGATAAAKGGSGAAAGASDREGADSGSDDGEVGQPSQSGAKLSKKAKRKAKAAAPPKGGYLDDGRTCKVCGERFESRSQLFKHIEATGHATLKT